MTRPRHTAKATRRHRTARHGGIDAGSVVALATIAAFALAMILAVHAGRAPAWLGAFYLAASAITFVAYAIDKSAARRGGPRTPERTLHALSLAGGWPGALAAQRLLRHKTAKASFQAVCWLTVALHVAGGAALWFLGSPQA